MLVTLTTNIQGHQRLYLGGMGSLEVWIEKAADDRRWTFHLNDGLGGNQLTDEQKHAAAIHVLLALADLLSCPPEDLSHVPFEVLASLHNAHPSEHRRMATPRRDLAQQAYLATAPSQRRPKGEFRAEHHAAYRDYDAQRSRRGR